MVLMAILGELGSGKTLSLTYLALRNYYKGRNIYANYALKKIPFTLITQPEQILQMHDGFAALDELWTWADSRASGSKKNKFITPILSKSRKRGVHLGYTCQYFKSIDIRIRTVTDFVCMPKMNEKESICRLFIYSNPSMVLQRVFKFRAAPIFELYDTNEEVTELAF